MQPDFVPPSRVWIAKASGFDIESMKSLLALTPEERLIRHEDLMVLGEEIVRSRLGQQSSQPGIPPAPLQRSWLAG